MTHCGSSMPVVEAESRTKARRPFPVSEQERRGRPDPPNSRVLT
jgi:hypothetical protein